MGLVEKLWTYEDHDIGDIEVPALVESLPRCLDAFLFTPGPFPIFLPTTATATPSHCPHPYFFREPPRSPATLSRQSYPVFSFAQFSNSSNIYLCFSITSRLIGPFATDSRHLVHISTALSPRSFFLFLMQSLASSLFYRLLFVSVSCSQSP